MPLARLTGWLRPVAMLLALTGAFALSACGGGSGSINNPNTNPPDPIATLFTLPAGIVIAYSQVPATIKIGGGLPPYQALSNNSAVLPVPLNVSGDTIVLVANPVAVGTDVPVAITVSDQSGQTAIANVIVRYAPLFAAGLTVTPSSANCGVNVCDGGTASVRAVATGVGGAPLPGRQIRFDVVYGPFSILTSNPALPIAATLTVVTDGAGIADIQIQATPNATTQQAQVRATDVATGQQQIANFIVERRTSTDNLSVVPPTAQIQTLYNNACSTGFIVDYYIYGGTPPYTVAATFPTAVTISPTVVVASGSFFRATTNGTCVNPLTFTIQDSAAKTVTATLINIPGTQAPPVTPPPPPPPPPPALTVTPNAAVSDTCTGQTFPGFVITGGTPPYNIAAPLGPVGVLITPSTVPNSGGSFAVSGLTSGTGVTTLIISDSAFPNLSANLSITCN
ncbi:hypothetical protein BURK1_00865 [Burkholderiales bacterium]|nr:hypothetical protein BURK1_00865 [Burkholderiales bacterium]